MLEAVKHYRAADFKQPLIVATADEESSMCGARALERKAAGCGGERGCNIRMHKGIMMESIRLTGRSGHSSDPALGINAMDAQRDG